LRGIKNVKLREAAHAPLHYHMTFDSANRSFVLFMKQGFVKYILFRGDYRGQQRDTGLSSNLVHTVWMQLYSRLASLKFPFALILAGTIFALLHRLGDSDEKFSWELVYCYVTNVTEQW